MRVANNMAIFGWVVVTALLAVVAAFTYIFVTKGPPPGYSAPLTIGVLMLFWMAGIAAAAHTFSKPRVVAEIAPGRLRITLRYPFTRTIRTYSAAEVRRSRIVQSSDVDGDPYFTTRIEMSDGREIDLAEGSSRERCEQQLAQFRNAMGLPLADAIAEEPPEPPTVAG